MAGVLGRTGRPCSVEASRGPSPHGVEAAQPQARPEWRRRSRRSGPLVRREGPILPTVGG
jgi:hypothetical protein